MLALRHGDRNRAEENIFIGNSVRNTGGVRIVNAGHKVLNNIFIGLSGKRFYSALALMDAVPNSLPNRYCVVEDVEICGNTFIDCTNIEFGTGRDEERTLAPRRILFADNSILNRSLHKPFMLDATDGFTFVNNRIDCLFKIRRLCRCPHQSKKSQSKMWQRKGLRGINAATATAIESKTIEVSPPDDLAETVASASAGDKIVLSAGEYSVDSPIEIAVPLTICAQNTKRPVIRYTGSKKGSMLVIVDGGSLRSAVSASTARSRQDAQGFAILLPPTRV